jgi:hypothetical protein
MNSNLTSGCVNSSSAGSAQRVRVGAIGDDEEFPVDETVRSGRKRRTGQRHRVGARLDFVFGHVGCSLAEIAFIE